MVLRHADDEHRDYEVLEQDFVATGGELERILAQPKNNGSEALHAFLMFRASEPNPVGLLGAMWIIEGLGEKMAVNWAGRIEELTGFESRMHAISALSRDNDDSHMDKLYAWSTGCARRESVADAAVVSTARSSAICMPATRGDRRWALTAPASQPFLRGGCHR